jgi:hypothetical protein
VTQLFFSSPPFTRIAPSCQALDGLVDSQPSRRLGSPSLLLGVPFGSTQHGKLVGGHWEDLWGFVAWGWYGVRVSRILQVVLL